MDEAPKPTTPSLEEIEGTVEIITYESENGEYVVARFQPEAGGDKITIVGSMMSLRPGEHLRVAGQWIVHKKFGRQFKVERFEVLVPTSIPGMIKYLGSGLIRGIGPELAKRIVNKFGTETIDILNGKPECLKDVPGIGPKTYEKILGSWRKHAAHREVMIFLEGYGLGPGLAGRVVEAYGASAISVIKANPYRLASDVSGIGFKTADTVAQNMGFALDSPQRVQAGVLFTLDELAGDGHSCYAYQELVPAAVQVLGVKYELVEEAVASLAKNEFVVIDESIASRPVYLRRLYLDEVGVATKLLLLAHGKAPLAGIKIDAAIEWVQNRQKVELAESQKRALAETITSKVSVITGGPGVGKTTIVNCIIPILRAKNLKVALAAPTGRAAKRLSEAANWDAATIHRMLKFNPRDGKFTFNESMPLDADAVIVDEASMIDINLMHHLLKAIPPHAMLVLVGDVDQLPPVGPGDVLREIIDSGTAKVSRLEEVFRQAQRSMIIVNAHRVNHGEMPLTRPAPEMLPDFYFLQEDDTERIPDVIRGLVTERLPKRFGLNPRDDIQVLTPMHKGVAGAQNLNMMLQECLNQPRPGEFFVQRGARSFRVGDKVMQILNNYDKDVFNGDIGRVAEINRIDETLLVKFDNRPVEYDFDELGQLVHAYAISVHKSQGSEYPAVVIPIVTQHYVMLQRNLLYTAITRGKKLVVLVGTMKAVARAVRNDAISQRCTHLRDRLRRSMKPQQEANDAEAHLP